MSYRDLENLGENIKDVIEDAVASQSYQRLNQSITKMVNEVLKPYQGNMPKDREREQLEKKRREEQEMYGHISGYQTKSILRTVFGGLLSFFMGNATLGFLIAGAGFAPTLFSLACFLGGLGLLYTGIRGIGRCSRFKKYRKAIAGKTYCEVKKLARTVGKPIGFVRKEIRQMISDGWFVEGHLDTSENTLITTDETFRQYQETERQYEETRKAAEAEQVRTQQKKAGRSPEAEEVLTRGNAFLDKIHKSNDAIPGEEISAKISRMEQIIHQIFTRAEEHPEVIPDLKRMMDYYLPTTVKLLDAYEDMDKQPIQGENIRSAKKEIEDTLDTLNTAFEKLLDSIFQDAAWDVSSDISVLNTVLAQEGLTESAFQVQTKKS